MAASKSATGGPDTGDHGHVRTSESTRRGSAVVIGGSISGLFAALVLARHGWRVDVYEKTPGELEGRGAGIVAQPELRAALAEAGIGDIGAVGVQVVDRILLDPTGARGHAPALPADGDIVGAGPPAAAHTTARRALSRRCRPRRHRPRRTAPGRPLHRRPHHRGRSRDRRRRHPLYCPRAIVPRREAGIFRLHRLA